MSDNASSRTQTDREMSLRYEGRCSLCGAILPKGARAIYSPTMRTVRHIACTHLEQGSPGSSAMREYERRKAKDEARVQSQVDYIQSKLGSGILGKVVSMLAVDTAPAQATTVWKQGAVGEMKVAARLTELEPHGVIVLHDRRIPGSRANIDHIAVTPWAVWVIDAKRYLSKRPTIYRTGGILGFGETVGLMVGGRKRDDLIDGVQKQCSRVQSALGNAAISVKGMLCFVDADWPLGGGDFTIQGIRVCRPKRLSLELLTTAPPMIDTTSVARLLATAFPSSSH